MRAATHAGAWYDGDGATLNRRLTSFLAEAPPAQPAAPLRALIVPHAGYSYSGRCAAWGYSCVEKAGVRRVVLLGPSHHVFLRKCALSGCTALATPLGDIEVDTEVVSRLAATGEFVYMDQRTDEAEHSLELHLPYLYKVLEGQQWKIVPIMVGALTNDAEERFGRVLAPLVDEPGTLFVVSSDFCHWGRRFNYVFYNERFGPIYKSIEALDRDGMDLIEAQSPEQFAAYLRKYENTICGRHPIAVFLHAARACATKLAINFRRYEQSSKCKSMADSSVSYASAIVTVAGPEAAQAAVAN